MPLCPLHASPFKQHVLCFPRHNRRLSPTSAYPPPPPRQPFGMASYQDFSTKPFSEQQTVRNKCQQLFFFLNERSRDMQIAEVTQTARMMTCSSLMPGVKHSVSHLSSLPASSLPSPCRRKTGRCLRPVSSCLLIMELPAPTRSVYPQAQDSWRGGAQEGTC